MVTLYDPDTRRPVRSIKAHEGLARALSFSPDGSILATAGEDLEVKLWDVESGELIRDPFYVCRLESLVILPDGRRIACSGTEGLYVLDLADRNIHGVPRLEESPAFDVSIAPDGSLLAASFGDHSIALFDADTGEKTSELPGHDARVLAVAFSPDGSRLVSGDGHGVVRLWDVGREVGLVGTVGAPGIPVEALVFSPNGKTLAVSGGDGVVRLWDVDSGRQLDTFIGHGGAVRSLSFSPDGRTLASGSRDGTVKLWDGQPAPGVVPDLLEPIRDKLEDLIAGAFSPDGTLLALGAGRNAIDYGSLTLFETESMTPLDAVKDHLIGTVAFSPDGETLVTGGHTLILYDLASGERRGVSGVPGWDTGGELSIRDVAISLDGKTLAAACKDESTRLVDIPTRAVLGSLPHSGEVNAVAFSPGARLLATGGDGPDALKLWDLDRREPVALPSKVSVRDLAFSPDGEVLAAAHEDGTITIWEVATRRLLGTLEGHSGWVLTIAFSPDGRTLASGGWDTSVRLWNLATLEELFTLSGHDDVISTVVFSPDGLALLSVGADNSARLWRAAGEPRRGVEERDPRRSSPKLSKRSTSAPLRIDVPRKDIAPVADGRIETGEYGSPLKVRFDSPTNPGRISDSGADAIRSPVDLSFMFFTAYTPEALYLAFEARDESLDKDVDGWGNGQDGRIELFIDGDGVSNDLWWGDRSGNREGFQIVAGPHGQRLTTSSDFSNAEWSCGASLVPGGYVLEFEIPLQLIDTKDGPESSQAGPGSILRFAAAISDIDSSGPGLEDYGLLWSEHPATLSVPMGETPFMGGEDVWPVELHLLPSAEQPIEPPAR